ncbi:UPF0481 protein [Actinidia chinensis var. chinensis]|uniref:UPF0481 protein n=1 Tax=Actinidia chinensis var. chinensis TaxID=1590841 RepID=A0A2R6P7K1_ACTCC|nr:UPF0481 protein [Actinidia chinensis var. chinensis]
MVSVLKAQKMDEEWVTELNKKLKHLENEISTRVGTKRSIYKVPSRMTEKNKEAYVPQVVSFGPYHHGEEHLMPMEEHKHRALFHFLKRRNMPLQTIVDNLTKVVQDLKDSYDSLGEVWQSDTGRFLRLMVLDGCFMLEVLCYYAEMSDSGNYAPKDPIFSAHGMLHVMNYIRRDMFLLENQLPMLVLIELAAAMNRRYTEKRVAREFVNRLIFWFTKSIWSGTGECLHLLDIFRKGMLWGSPKGRGEYIIHVYDDRKITVSAMDLQEAGIRFELSKCGLGEILFKDRIVSLQISFNDRVLHLPFLFVDDATETMFLNLIAFERLHVGAGNEVTSYVYFMNAIINSVEDVILLQSHGIIHNALESNKAVVQLFNLLAKDIMFNPDSIMASMLYDINVYRTKRWVTYRAKFAHAYHLSTQWSPWGSWSIIFGIVLSIVQTAYTIYRYYHPNK